MKSQESEQKFQEETGGQIKATYQEYAGGPAYETGYTEEYVQWLQKQIVIMANNGVLSIEEFQPKITEEIWVHIKNSTRQCVATYLGNSEAMTWEGEIVEITHWVVNGAEKMKQSFLGPIVS